jgi:light-regulated signal transduction histidine kinase (bacteriophytochrome)
MKDTVQAKVLSVNEFKEIMTDFTNPLEIFRETVQNSYDAGATEIIITLDNNEETKRLDIVIEDNGEGLLPKQFSNFFDLGNSTKRGTKNKQYIGEKGHGTKICYNSDKLVLESWCEGKKYYSEMDMPRYKLTKKSPPEVPSYTKPAEVPHKEKNNREHASQFKAT